jgi:hypothetical protein
VLSRIKHKTRVQTNDVQWHDDNFPQARQTRESPRPPTFSTMSERMWLRRRCAFRIGSDEQYCRMISGCLPDARGGTTQLEISHRCTTSAMAYINDGSFICCGNGRGGAFITNAIWEEIRTPVLKRKNRATDVGDRKYGSIAYGRSWYRCPG